MVITMSTTDAPRWEYIVLCLIPLGTVWGNVFVCLAVYLERRLRHRFNLFLVSLAFSDLLCAVLVMPFSAWQMINGGTSVNRILCLIWYSLDIFFTATTIIHLCTISLDRYLALRRLCGQIQRVPRFLSGLRMRIMISWLIPFLIAGPLFLIALYQQEQEFEKIDTQGADNQQQESPITNGTACLTDKSYKGCGPNDPTFVLTAIVVTFILPLIIVTATYALTIRTLKAHMTHVKKVRLYETQIRSVQAARPTYPKRVSSQLLRVEEKPRGEMGRSKSVREPISPVDSQELEKNKPTEELKTSLHIPLLLQYRLSFRQLGRTPDTSVNDVSFVEQPSHAIDKMTGEDSAAVNTGSQMTAGNNQQIIENKSSIYDDIEMKSQSQRVNISSQHRSAIARIHSGKRALRVIGVLFGLFVACYLPFFVIYMLDVFCIRCKQWTGVTISHLEWLGYLSSMLNPVVYHSFNSTFRRTFRRMFRCKCNSESDHATWCRRIRL